MSPIEFPEQTDVLAKNQPQYTPLPVHVGSKEDGFPMTVCFELSDEEVAEMIVTKKLWYTQITFGNPFQPIRLSSQNPFTPQIVGSQPGLNIELAHLLNKYSKENGSNTPDFVLAKFMLNCLQAFDTATLERQAWYTGEKI